LLRDRGLHVLAFDLRDPPEIAQGVEFVPGDVRDVAALAALAVRVDAVIHLAAEVGVEAYLTRPDDVLDVNILGTRNVLRACEAHGLPVVVASTSEVYGRAGGVLSESSDGLYGPPSAQRWCYATSKRAAEHYAFAAAARGLPCAVVRFFNVYGAALDAVGHERVVTRFVRAVQRGEPLVVHGDGSDVRAFCHVDDAAEGLVRVFEALAAGRDDVRGRAFNIGRDEPVTVASLAGAVVALTGHAAGVRWVPAADDHGAGFDPIPHRVPDLGAIEGALGWRAETSLDAGLRRVLGAHGLLRPDAPSAADEPPIPWVRPCIEPDAALMATIHRSLSSGAVTNEGPEVAAFERELGAWLDAPHVAAVGSGTVALTLAAMALGLRGRAVMPAFTFVATQAAFARAGVGAVFCDIDPERWTLDPDALARVLAAHDDISAVVAVNVYGVAPDLARIGALCRAAGVALVYDAAHGVGARVDGARAPAEPDVIAHSLHATKVLPAVEGGAAVTRDAALDREIRRLRRHGLADDPRATTPSLNGRMDELRAAVGRHTLRGLDAALARRRSYAERLRAAAAGAGGFTLQRLPERAESSHQNLGVLCDRIEVARASFEASGVETRRYFFPALHQLSGAPRGEGLPVTERVAAAALCLPLHARMDERTIARVEAAVGLAGRAQRGTR
jgi:UDP-glucose 4-epimerase